MIQPRNMLRLQQMVLQNVSKDKDLFKQELEKSLKRLQTPEILELHYWLTENFQTTHKEIINEVFDFIDGEGYHKQN